MYILLFIYSWGVFIFFNFISFFVYFDIEP